MNISLPCGFRVEPYFPEDKKKPPIGEKIPWRLSFLHPLAKRHHKSPHKAELRASAIENVRYSGPLRKNKQLMSSEISLNSNVPYVPKALSVPPWPGSFFRLFARLTIPAHRLCGGPNPIPAPIVRKSTTRRLQDSGICMGIPGISQES